MEDVFRGAVIALYFGPPVYFLYVLWRLRDSQLPYSNTALITFWMIATLYVAMAGAAFNDPIWVSGGETLNGLLIALISLGFVWPLWDILRLNQKQNWKAVLPLISIAMLIPNWDGVGLLAMDWWYLAPQGFAIPLIYWFWPRGKEGGKEGGKDSGDEGAEKVPQTPEEKKKLLLQLLGVAMFFISVLYDTLNRESEPLGFPRVIP